MCWKIYANSDMAYMSMIINYLNNAKEYDAKVKVLAESKEQAQKPLGLNGFLNWPKVDVPAGQKVTIKLN